MRIVLAILLCSLMAVSGQIPPMVMDDLLAVTSISVPSAAEFSPTNIAGCKLWLKADAITNAVDGSKVAFWPDSSGNNMFVTPMDNTAIIVKNFQNGLPAVEFYGSSAASNLANTVEFTNWTVFLVLNNTNGSYRGPLNVRRTTTSHGFLICGESAATNTWVPHLVGYRGGGEAMNLKGPSMPVPTGWREMCFTYGTGIVTNYHTNNIASTLVTATTGWGNNLNCVGFAYSAFYGFLGEIILYDSALSDSDRTSVHTYLQRWGAN